MTGYRVPRPARTVLGQRRQRCGFPRQGDLAAALGISGGYVSDIEVGVRRGNDELLTRWASLLAWTLDDVLAAIPPRARRRNGLIPRERWHRPHPRAKVARKVAPKPVAEPLPPVALIRPKAEPVVPLYCACCGTPIGRRGEGEALVCLKPRCREQVAA